MMEHGDGRRWYRVSIGRNDCNPNDPSMKYASPITLSSHITNTNSNKFINNTNATTTNNQEDNNKNNSNYFDDDDDDEVVTFIDMTNSFELDPKSGYHKDSYLYSARTGHSIVYFEKKLFIFGGTDRVKRNNDLFCLDLSTSPSMKFDDLSQNKYRWKLISPKHASKSIPPGRSGATAGIVSRSIVIFGGHDGRRGTFFNDIWEYNIDANEWKEVKPQKPENLTDSATRTSSLSSNSQNIFSMNFRLEDSQSYDSQSDDQHYQTTTPSSDSSSFSSPKPRTDHSMVVWNNSLVIFGGFDGAQRWNDVHMFNFATRTWVELWGKRNYSNHKKMSTEPSPRFGHSAIVHNNIMWIFGGWDGCSTLDDLWCFDLHALTWQEITFDSASSSSSTRISIESGNSAKPRSGFSLLSCAPPSTPMHTLFSRRASSSIISNDPNTPIIQETGHRIDQIASPGSKSYSSYSPSQSMTPNLNTPVPRPYERNEDVTPVSFYNGAKTPRIATTTPKKSTPRSEGYQYYRAIDIRSQSTSPARKRLFDNILPFTKSAPIAENGSQIDSDADISHSQYKRSHSFKPSDRYRHSAVVYDGAMYIFGGVDKMQKRYNDVAKLDLNTCQWEKINCLGMSPSERTFHAAVLIDSVLFVTGGYDGLQRLNDSFFLQLGSISPPSLAEICAKYVRNNYQEVLEKSSFDDTPVTLLESLVWQRTSYDNVARGGLFVSKSATREPVQVCEALCIEPRSVYLSSEEMMASLKSIEICKRCGERADKHDAIDDPYILAILDGTSSPVISLVSSNRISKHQDDDNHKNISNDDDGSINENNHGTSRTPNSSCMCGPVTWMKRLISPRRSSSSSLSRDSEKDFQEEIDHEQSKEITPLPQTASTLASTALSLQEETPVNPSTSLFI